jgi:hypothetical protein
MLNSNQPGDVGTDVQKKIIRFHFNLLIINAAGNQLQKAK